jgi:hypothetical protein
VAQDDSDQPLVSFAQVAATGDMRKTLEALRDHLAFKLDRADPAVAAQIAGQLRQVLKDLQALPAPKGGSKRDEAREKREARRVAAAAPVPAAPKGGRKRGG